MKPLVLGMILVCLCTQVAPVATAQEPPRTLESDDVDTSDQLDLPLMLLFQAGLGGPTGLFGGTIAYEIDPPLAGELGFGLGSTGWQLSLMGRYFFDEVTDSSRFSLGVGPSIGLLSERFDLNVPHRADLEIDPTDIFHIVFINLEVGYDLRASWGGTLRFALGVEFIVAENMSGLCEGVPQGNSYGWSDCNPAHWPGGPQIANAPLLPYLTFGYGWSF